ncbi:MAG: hypothetical protein OXD40_04685 [bacterium]|nr:hypothetical protein [bacterium]
MSADLTAGLIVLALLLVFLVLPLVAVLRWLAAQRREANAKAEWYRSRVSRGDREPTL